MDCLQQTPAKNPSLGDWVLWAHIYPDRMLKGYRVSAVYYFVQVPDFFRTWLNGLVRGAYLFKDPKPSMLELNALLTQEYGNPVESSPRYSRWKTSRSYIELVDDPRGIFFTEIAFWDKHQSQLAKEKAIQF
jgi:hypothetical protein